MELSFNVLIIYVGTHDGVRIFIKFFKRTINNACIIHQFFLLLLFSKLLLFDSLEVQTVYKHAIAFKSTRAHLCHHSSLQRLVVIYIGS